MSEPVHSAPCMWMRGGTSKGGYFLAQDLPQDTGQRDQFLLGIMGSPDPRQIDGMGGGNPLTSKVAVVGKSSRNDADVDYLFLQVVVDNATVSSAQNCGNILAGVAPFAIERGLMEAGDEVTDVRIYMENTGQIAVASVQTPGGMVTYHGETAIDGVPGTAAGVALTFADTAGSLCGVLLPSGNVVDVVDGVEVTLIDNGMPTVILRASDMSITGLEAPEQLENNQSLRQRLETIRLKAGTIMKLGDVTNMTVPKMTMVSPPTKGGAISTRTFIPHSCHVSIGVLCAVSVATAAILEGSIAAELAVVPSGTTRVLNIEHPSGATTIITKLDKSGNVESAAILRTARKLSDGLVFAPLAERPIDG